MSALFTTQVSLLLNAGPTLAQEEFNRTRSSSTFKVLFGRWDASHDQKLRTCEESHLVISFCFISFGI